MIDLGLDRLLCLSLIVLMRIGKSGFVINSHEANSRIYYDMCRHENDATAKVEHLNWSYQFLTSFWEALL